MPKAFSLLEVIIVIVVISIITTFFLSKSSTSIDYGNEVKVKSQVSLIRSSIQKENSKNILLNKEINSTLDDANINEENTMLFTNILQTPLSSTNSIKKDIGKWIKTSKNEYEVFLNENQVLKFKYEDSSFKCISDVNLCKAFE